MKTRRHHNNTGIRQIQRGHMIERTERLAAELGVPVGAPAELTPNEMNLAAHTRWMNSAIEHGNKEGASHHAGMANHYAVLVAQEKRNTEVTR